MSSRSLERSTSAPARSDASPETVDIRGEELFELLDDVCTRTVLRATVEEPRPARELVAAAAASRATVYRRLDRLEAVGLLEATSSSEGGRTRYRATLDRVTVTLDAGGVTTRVEVSGDRTSPGGGTEE